MVFPTITLEATFGNAILDAEGNPILDAEGNEILDTGWDTDILNDLRASVPIHITKGNKGGDPKDRVANIGTMRFAMDNSASNSAGLIGYYSPSNPNCRSGFEEITAVRLKMAYNGTEKYKFQGIRLDTIDPDSGIYGKLLCHVTTVDWMEEAGITPAKGLTIQQNKRDDQLLTLLLALMAHAPESTDFDVGPDQYTVAFADVQSENDSVLALMQSVAQSGLSKVFLIGDTTTGEKLIYKTRHTILSETVPVATLDNSMLSITAQRKARSRTKKVIGITYPVRVDSAATTVLFSTAIEYTLLPGQTITFTGRYRDPSGGDTRIAGLDIVDPLVAGTDYNFSSVSGSGSDLNGSLGVSITPYADSVDFVFTNNAAVTGYLLAGAQVRGKGVYRYDPVVYIAEDPTIQKGETLTWEMPYQDSYSTGKNIADALLVWESVVENERPVVHFVANRTEALMLAAINVEPTDLVTITETVTGVDKNYFVDAIELDIKHGGRRVDVYWYCTPAPESQGLSYCILDYEGYAELDSTAVLAF